MYRRIISFVAAFLLLAIGGDVAAQWGVGARLGKSYTTISRYNAGRIDETYTALDGINAGIQGRYSFNSWLAVRANLEIMQRSHRMDRNLNYLDRVFTDHINTYLMLPVMADFSFGGQQLRGHLLAGGYGGYWLRERRLGTTYWMTDYYVYFEDFDEVREFNDSDIRFNAGLSVGAAFSYTYSETLELGIEAMYHYDLTSHHKGYPHLADPRYLNTFSINLSVFYKL